LNFSKTADAAAKIAGYGETFAPAKAISVEGYMAQTLATTIKQIEGVTLTVAAISIAASILITVLFLKLILAKDHRQIIIMKGLGFTAAHIQTQYIAASVICLLGGLAAGTAAANTLGETLVGLLMSGMGASKISFIIDPFMSYAVYPCLFLAAIILAAIYTTGSIKKSGNYVITD
jgi:putative ABC transport system permease protein